MNLSLDPSTGYAVDRKGNLVLPSEPPSLPEWLSPPRPPPAPLSPALIQERSSLRAAQMDAVFVHLIDRISEGETIKDILRSDPRGVTYREMMVWIRIDPDRRNKYEDAIKIRAEGIIDEVIKIADAVDSLEDVARSKTRIDTRLKIAGFDNKERFAPTQTINVNTEISITRVNSRLDAAIARAMLPKPDDVEDIECRNPS